MQEFLMINTNNLTEKDKQRRELMKERTKGVHS